VVLHLVSRLLPFFMKNGSKDSVSKRLIIVKNHHFISF
jgi:hypothetical protein